MDFTAQTRRIDDSDRQAGAKAGRAVERPRQLDDTDEIEISVAMSQAGGLFIADFLRSPARISEEGFEAILAAGIYRAMRGVDLDERLREKIANRKTRKKDQSSG
jgi:hypothetical protein